MADAPTADRPCSKCEANPRMAGQVWCKDCFAHQRKAALTAKRASLAHQVCEVPPIARSIAPYQPDLPAGHPAWWSAYLTHVAYNGGLTLAAYAAGVSPGTVRNHAAQHAVFAAEREAAHDYYRDLLEWESVRLGRQKSNVVGYLARLKAELPDRYIDRSLTASLAVSASTHTLSPADARALLDQMLAVLTPSAVGRLHAARAALPAASEGGEDGGASSPPTHGDA